MAEKESKTRRDKMNGYIIYESEYGDFLVEMLNEGREELYRIEKSLIEQGFIISKVEGLFIKCHKVREEQ